MNIPQAEKILNLPHKVEQPKWKSAFKWWDDHRNRCNGCSKCEPDLNPSL